MYVMRYFIILFTGISLILCFHLLLVIQTITVTVKELKMDLKTYVSLVKLPYGPSSPSHVHICMMYNLKRERL